MTEAEWPTWSGNPRQMALLLGGTPLPRTATGGRKLRLVACGGCRLIWEYLDATLRRVVEVAEGYADGKSSAANLEAARAVATGRVAGRAVRNIGEVVARTRAAAVSSVTHSKPLHAAIGFTDLPLTSSGYTGTFLEAWELVRGVFRDVLGDPFRPVEFAPAWRTDTALSLARVVYETRDFTGMPILADALQDAGCDNEDVLTHCRDPKAAHVRGCWVVDSVLGKA